MNETNLFIGIFAGVVFCAGYGVAVRISKEELLGVWEYCRLEQVSPVGISEFAGYDPFAIAWQVASRGGVASVDLFIIKDFPNEIVMFGASENKVTIVCRESFLSEITDKEFEGIIAHEIGHMLNFTDSVCYFLNRSFFGFFWCGIFLLFAAPFFWVESSTNFYAVAGMLSPAMCSALLSALCYGTCLVLRKRREFAADKRALFLTRYPSDFVNFLSRMTFNESLCGFLPEKITDTHPPTWKRVRAAQRILRKQGVI